MSDNNLLSYNSAQNIKLIMSDFEIFVFIVFVMLVTYFIIYPTLSNISFRNKVL